MARPMVRTTAGVVSCAAAATHRRARGAAQRPPGRGRCVLRVVADARRRGVPDAAGPPPGRARSGRPPDPRGAQRLQRSAQPARRAAFAGPLGGERLGARHDAGGQDRVHEHRARGRSPRCSRAPEACSTPGAKRRTRCSRSSRSSSQSQADRRDIMRDVNQPARSRSHHRPSAPAATLDVGEATAAHAIDAGAASAGRRARRRPSTPHGAGVDRRRVARAAGTRRPRRRRARRRRRSSADVSSSSSSATRRPSASGRSPQRQTPHLPRRPVVAPTASRCS